MGSCDGAVREVPHPVLKHDLRIRIGRPWQTGGERGGDLRPWPVAAAICSDDLFRQLRCSDRLQPSFELFCKHTGIGLDRCPAIDQSVIQIEQDGGGAEHGLSFFAGGPIQAANAGMMQPEPVTLSGQCVRLEPLALGHAADLAVVAAEPEIWHYMPARAPRNEAEVTALIEQALAEAQQGTRLPFAIIDLSSGRAVGSTSYLDIAPAHRRIEIGWTWLGAQARRTAINTECKYLLLRHAFETLGCGRVQLKTDGRNLRSQAAIERLGAVKEGVLHRHMILPVGYVRDTVMYSITAGEWPLVTKRLAGFLRG